MTSTIVNASFSNQQVKDFGDYKSDTAELTCAFVRCVATWALSSVDVYCTAISQHRRLYSLQLFTLAEDIVKDWTWNAYWGLIPEKVAELATCKASEEDLVNAVPVEFL